MSELLTVTDLEIAKKHDTFHSEVITGKAGGVAAGAKIDAATNAVTGQVQKTLPKVMEEIAGNHLGDWPGTGDQSVTLTNVAQTLRWQVADGGDGHDYAWTGAFPKIVAAGSTPTPLGAGGWVDRSDVVLRDQLAESTGATKVGTSDGRTVEQRLAAIPNEVENLLGTDEVMLGGRAASVPLDLGRNTSSFLWLANGVNITSVVISNETSIRVGQEFTLRISAGTVAITISGWDAAIKWPEGSSALASLAGFRSAIIKMRYVQPGTFVVTNTTIYV